MAMDDTSSSEAVLDMRTDNSSRVVRARVNATAVPTEYREW
jgi:hypothetical protein